MNHHLVDLPFCTKGKNSVSYLKKKVAKLRRYSSGGRGLAYGHKDMSSITRTHIKSSECSG